MSDPTYTLSALGERKFDEHVRIYGDPSRSVVRHFFDFQVAIASQAVVGGKPQPLPWYWRPVPPEGEVGLSQAYYAIDFSADISAHEACKSLALP